jgi:hypothetical protein
MKRNEMGWRTEVVGNGERKPLPTLDRPGRLLISYYDASDGDLKHAHHKSSPGLSVRVRLGGSPHRSASLTYTLALSGPGLRVRLWDPLPPSLRYVPGSLDGNVTPAAVYDPSTHAIVWRGTLPSDAEGRVCFQVAPRASGAESLVLLLPIVNTAWLTDEESGRSIWATLIVNGQVSF